MKIMNADGTYSHCQNNCRSNQNCINHIIGELGYLSSNPINNVFRVKRNCIMNIRHAHEIMPVDRQFLIKLIKHADYEQAQLGILKIINHE